MWFGVTKIGRWVGMLEICMVGLTKGIMGRGRG